MVCPLTCSFCLLAPDHCPNFIPNHVEREWFNKTKPFLLQYFHNDPWKVDDVIDKAANFTLQSKVIPLRVKFKGQQIYLDSLAHFWKSWYQEYFDTIDGRENDYPRLMIRLEDLVFYPQLVLKTICDCVGGTLREKLVLAGETSKKGDNNVHGSNKTDLRTAMIAHIYTNRTKGMTLDDVRYASSVLKDSQVLQTLGYPNNPL